MFQVITVYGAVSCCVSCRDKEKAEKAQETVLYIGKLTQKFQDAVLIVQEEVRTDASTVEASLHFMSCVEKMVLLQREWSTKVLYNLHRLLCNSLYGCSPHYVFRRFLFLYMIKSV